MDGLVNFRDVGGVATSGGGRVRPGVLLRSDNLQALPETSVRRIVDELGVTDIVDLRTVVEVVREGPGPMTREPVTIHHHTLYVESADEHGIPDVHDGDDLPWQGQEESPHGDHDSRLADHYLRYFTMRPDSVVAALRAIAHADGAVLVHCAAGKDRTGTIVALALTSVGVSEDDAAADYGLSNERTALIVDRLRASATYADDLADQDVADQATNPETMHLVLRALRERHGGPLAWLRAHGWTDADQAALEAKLLQPDGPPADDE